MWPAAIVCGVGSSGAPLAIMAVFAIPAALTVPFRAVEAHRSRFPLTVAAGLSRMGMRSIALADSGS